MTDKKTQDTTLYCSFCAKNQHEVRKLIAGPSVFICDECVELCMNILVMPNDGMTEYPAERHSVVRRIKYEAGKLAEYRNPERIKLIVLRQTAKDYLAKIKKELVETSDMATISDLSFQVQGAAKYIEELDAEIRALPAAKAP